MAAAQYYSNQDLGESYIHDDVPLLPAKPGISSIPQEPPNQSQYQHAPYDQPLQPSTKPSPTPVSTSQNSSQTQYTVNQPQTPPPRHTVSASRIPKFKKYIRLFIILRFISHGLSSILNAVMFGLMIFTYETFTRTKNTIVEAKNAWPTDAKTWPTIMLLLIAAVTLLASVANLIANCVCMRRQGNWKLIVLGYVIHIGSWLIVTFLYRYEKGLHGNNNDLWSWSCGDSAKELQNDFHSNIDFNLLCKVQVSRLVPRWSSSH